MSYLLGTEAWLCVMASAEAYPLESSPPELFRAAEATRKWSESVSPDLIHVSIVTYGEICVIRKGATTNLSLLYELNEAIDTLDTTTGEERILDLTKEDMTHWANIYAALGDEPDLRLEDSFVLAQALCQGFTYVGQRTATITLLEAINLSFLDPEEWSVQQDPA